MNNNVRNRRPTMRDVASLAGVSTATVSMVINGRNKFTPEVTQRVLAAIKSLNYQPNAAASSMVTGRTRCIGLAILDIRNPYFSNIAQGANSIAQPLGYSLIIADTAENPQQAFPQLNALASRVDGLIVSSRLPEACIDQLLDFGKPIVMFGQTDRNEAQHLKTSSVQVNSHKAGYMLGRHLYETGRRNITYVSFPHSLWDSYRLQGLRDAMPTCAIRVIPVPTQSMEAGENIAANVLLDGNEIDAVVCYNDMIAIGLMHEAYNLGVLQPGRIAIAGFDNIPAARFLTPPLTTVDLCSELQGVCATERLLEILETGDRTITEKLLEPRLVVRASTAAHP